VTAFRAETLGGLTRALQEAGKACNELIRAGKTAVIEVREDSRTRTSIQNGKIHAMLTDISRQVELHGKKYSPHVWKRLTTAQFLRDKGERPLVLLGLDDEFVVLWEKTSKMSTKVMAEYIEWLYYFGTQESVEWSEK
jgi:hypothetical protein